MSSNRSPEEDFGQVPPQLLKRMNRYKVTRASTCINCGLCASLCPYGVHGASRGTCSIMPAGGARMHRAQLRVELILLRQELPDPVACP